MAHVHAQVARGRPLISEIVACDLRQALRDLQVCQEAWSATCDVLTRQREADEAARKEYAEAHQPPIPPEVVEAPTYGFILGAYPRFGHDARRACGRCVECEESTMLTLGIVNSEGGSWCLDRIQKLAEEAGIEGDGPRFQPGAPARDKVSGGRATRNPTPAVATPTAIRPQGGDGTR